MFPLKIQNLFLIPHVLYAVTGFPLCHSICKVIMDKKVLNRWRTSWFFNLRKNSYSYKPSTILNIRSHKSLVQLYTVLVNMCTAVNRVRISPSRGTHGAAKAGWGGGSGCQYTSLQQASPARPRPRYFCPD